MLTLPYRAIVSDLDGTLLNADHILGDFTIDTLRKLYEKGGDVILATGRGYGDVKHIFARLNLEKGAMITSNGAEAHDLQGNLLYSNYLADEIAEQLFLTPFDDSRVCINSYQADGWFLNIDIPQFKKYHQESGFMYQVTDFRTLRAKNVEKVFFIAKTHQDLIETEQLLRQKFGDICAITYSTPYCLEVMNKNVSKATALSAVLAMRDYDERQCIAFGDGMNDVEMLSAVKKGCIMQNADVRLPQRCPELEIIGHHSHEAVAAYIRAVFGLI